MVADIELNFSNPIQLSQGAKQDMLVIIMDSDLANQVLE